MEQDRRKCTCQYFHSTVLNFLGNLCIPLHAFTKTRTTTACWAAVRSGRQSHFVSVQKRRTKNFLNEDDAGNLALKSESETTLAIWLSNLSLRFSLLFGSTAAAVDTRLHEYDKFWFSSINMAAMQERTWQIATLDWPTLPVHFFFPRQLTLFALRLHYRRCEKEVWMPDICDWLQNSEGTAK